MKTPLIALTTGLVLACLAGSADAGTPAQRSEIRERHQEVRIARGVIQGDLTAREAGRLVRGQQRVDVAQAAAHADGRVGPREALRLEHLQDRQSRRIAVNRHDAQRRPR